jgi:hypothetical protein
MLRTKRREGVEGPWAMCSRVMMVPDESLTTRMKCQATGWDTIALGAAKSSR